MLKWRWILITICLIVPTAYAQQRPLRTDDAEILKTGRIRADFGIEFLQSQRYSLSGLQGDLTRLGVSSIHVGVGEYAEFEISGVAQDVLAVSDRTEPVIPPTFSGNTTRDFGDLILGAKLKLAGEQGYWPAMATEFYSSLLFKKHWGRAQLMADMGFAILGSPVLQGRQTDPLTYGIAAVVPVHRSMNLVAEINGRQGPPRRVGNENKSQARAGIQFWTRGIRWDLAGVAGLTHFDPKSGIVVGATYEFQAFQRSPSPVTIKN